MTPNAYAYRYHKLDVPCPDGTSVTVSLRKYVSGGIGPDGAPPPAEQRLWALVLAKLTKEKSLTVQVSDGGKPFEQTFTHKGELTGHIASPFYGKGSPESVQILLQLALRVDPKITKAGLQDYCDQHLGIDCNGFVGNYLRHEVDGRPWDSLQARHDPTRGPSTDIATLLGHHFIKDVSELKFSQMYIMGLADPSTGRVYPGGNTTPPGHIVVVEPYTLCTKPSLFTRDKCFGPGFPADPTKTPALWVVESTGSLGITQSWYNIAANRRGIFTVYRGCKSGTMPVRIAPVL
jgi:hypothetical protein